MTDYTFYLIDKKPPLAWVYLNRPEKKNAMNPPAWQESIPVFADLDQDPDVRAVILSGKGNAFSAGIDLIAMSSALSELGNREQLGGIKWNFIPKIKAMQDTMTCIEQCRKPVIAAVHGYCIGAGLDMITACDIRLCSSDAVFSLREAAVGFVADVGVLQRLPHIVGQGITRELAYTAKNIDAKRAREILLVNEIFTDHAALMAGAEAMAMEIAANSPLAVQASKNVLNFGIGKTTVDALDYVASISCNIIPSEDLYESITAFTERRKPNFTGR